MHHHKWLGGYRAPVEAPPSTALRITKALFG